MANIVSYNDIIELFTDIAQRHYQINTFFLGRDYELENNADLQYPVLQVFPEFASMPINDWKQYKTLELTLNCKVFDLVVPGEGNEKDVHSDTLRICQDIVNEINAHPFYNRSNISLIDTINFTALEEFEDDFSAGWQFSLKLRILNGNTFCGMPIAQLAGVSANGPTSTGTIVNVQYLTCDTLEDCPVIEDIQDDIEDLDIRVTALEQGGGGGNFIPLTGTNPGADVTGPIQFTNNLISAAQSINGDDGSYLGLTGQITSLTQYNTATNTQAALNLIGAQFSLAGFDMTSGIVVTLSNDTNGTLQFISNGTNSEGITGNQNFSSFYQPNSFIQKVYADGTFVPITLSTLSGITSNIQNIGARIFSTVTDTNNGDIYRVDHRNNRYIISSMLNGGDLTSLLRMQNGIITLDINDISTGNSATLSLLQDNFDVFSQATTGSYFNIQGQNTGSLLFEVTGVNDTITIKINDNDALVGASDYTPFYSAFSFVQKIYVDNAIAGIPASTLAQVLAVGNSTGANNIVIDAGQLLTNATNNNYLALNYNSTPDIRLQSVRDLNLFAEYINITPSNGGVLNVNGTGVVQRGAISTTLNMDAQLAFSTNSGSYRAYVYVKDSDQTFNLYTVNSDTIFYNGPGSNQYQTLKMTYDNHVIINDLIGSGTRMVVADLNGQLSTQTIPAAITYSAGTGLQLTGTTFNIGGGPSTSFIKADGSYDATTYLTSAALTSYVPYTGATTDLTMGAHNITTQALIANGTGGLGYLRIMGQSSAPSVPATTGGNIYFNGSGNLAWNRKPQLGTDTFSRTFSGIITADRAYVLPDQAGTVALTSDITTALAPYLLSSTAASTYEVLANKAINFTTVNNTLYPSVQAVVNYVTGLGYLTTASAAATYQPIGSYEVTTNKTTSFGTLNNTLYPTTQAVSTYAGANFVGRVYRDTVDGTGLTGTTTETINKSILIPANTFAAGDVIVIKAIAIKSGTEGTVKTRIRTNTSLSLSGATTVGLLTSGATGIFNSMERDMIVKGATTQTYGTVTTAIDELTAATARQLLSIDWTIPQYVMISLQNSVVGDTSFVSFFSVEKH